jgi:hypothetical protein
MRYTMPAVILGWLTACGGGGANASGNVTSADTVILCSATMGPIAGKPGQNLDAGDAGDLQECQPGGQCTYVTSPPPGPEPACDVGGGSGHDGGLVVTPGHDSGVLAP